MMTLAHAVGIEVPEVRLVSLSSITGNGDMHLKNWSLIYRDRKRPQLSPGYDFVSTIPYLQNGKLALKLGRSKNMTDVSMEQFSSLAAKARLPQQLVLNTVEETVDHILTVWPQHLQESQIKPTFLNIIGAHISDIAARLRR